ncbi:type IV secretion system protein [Brevundimonas sp. NPDC090276]|uniref:type IV secretion system protein n=1 Tax=Brevundimonas sp. NPDC090276 TaxID=3363956 RepID=UPI00383B79AC
MATCPRLSTGEAFLSTLLRHIDCQAQTIGADGYQALADPGSPFALALTGLLTIFIALFGLRMMLGQTPTVRDGVMAVVKIGVVLTIAASWPGYRTVVYDVVVQGPAQLSAALGRAAGLPGRDGDLVNRLQSADTSIIRLINYGTGRDDLAVLPSANPNEPAQRTPIADNAALGWARVFFLSSTIAAFAAVRLTAGVLLALAPLFAGLLLFDMASGLFVGWLRALLFALLASVATTMVLGVQLALLEPWLAQVIQLRQSNALAAAAPIELLVICLAFALSLFASLGILLRLAFTVHVQAGRSEMKETAPAPARPEPQPNVMPPERTAPEHAAPRAQAVASALMAAQRRERASSPPMSTGALAAVTGRSPGGGFNTGDDFAIPTTGQALRRTRPRKSVSAVLRDRRS